MTERMVRFLVFISSGAFILIAFIEMHLGIVVQGNDVWGELALVHGGIGGTILLFAGAFGLFD